MPHGLFVCSGEKLFGLFMSGCLQNRDARAGHDQLAADAHHLYQKQPLLKAFYDMKHGTGFLNRYSRAVLEAAARMTVGTGQAIVKLQPEFHLGRKASADMLSAPSCFAWKGSCTSLHCNPRGSKFSLPLHQAAKLQEVRGCSGPNLSFCIDNLVVLQLADCTGLHCMALMKCECHMER